MHWPMSQGARNLSEGLERGNLGWCAGVLPKREQQQERMRWGFLPGERGSGYL